MLNKAIWIKDGSIKFNVAKKEEISSVYYDSRFIEPVTIEVESIDFGRWLEDNFSIDDYIIVSLDIQGSEAEVLHKMASDRTIQYVDRLYVEFHDFGHEAHGVKVKRLRNRLLKLQVLKGEDSVEDIIKDTGEMSGEWDDI